jgi:hypothetical protein
MEERTKPRVTFFLFTPPPYSAPLSRALHTPPPVIRTPHRPRPLTLIRGAPHGLSDLDHPSITLSTFPLGHVSTSTHQSSRFLSFSDTRRCHTRQTGLAVHGTLPPQRLFLPSLNPLHILCAPKRNPPAASAPALDSGRLLRPWAVLHTPCPPPPWSPSPAITPGPPPSRCIVGIVVVSPPRPGSRRRLMLVSDAALWRSYLG